MRAAAECTQAFPRFTVHGPGARWLQSRDNASAPADGDYLAAPLHLANEIEAVCLEVRHRNVNFVIINAILARQCGLSANLGYGQ